MLFEIFLPCFFGNEIILSSDNLSYCLFSSDWVEQTITYKKKMIIFAERLKRPIVITAGKFVKLSLITFTSVCIHFGVLKDLTDFFNQNLIF